MAAEDLSADPGLSVSSLDRHAVAMRVSVPNPAIDCWCVVVARSVALLAVGTTMAEVSHCLWSCLTRSVAAGTAAVAAAVQPLDASYASGTPAAA